MGSIGRIARFMAQDNIRLNGMLFSRPGSGKTCVIFIHGMKSTFINNISLALAAGLDKRFAFFSFSNRGHDAVFSASRFVGNRRKRIAAGTNFEKFEDCIYDIGGAIDAMRSIGYRRFVLVGHSTGCQKVIYYQYKKRDRRVAAIVLVGPADDYSLFRNDLGRRHGAVLKACRKLMRSGIADEIPDKEVGFSAQRLDSVLNLDRPEARIFDYNGGMKEFGSIKTPILAIFGSEEQYKTMKISRYLEILDKKSNSSRFNGLEIWGADHFFEGYGGVLVKNINAWLSKI